jgi:hypothetical protein
MSSGDEDCLTLPVVASTGFATLNVGELSPPLSQSREEPHGMVTISGPNAQEELRGR